MGQVAIFIDGGYLDKVVYYDHGNRRLDYESLALEIAKPDELVRTYYYHCLPYQSNPPTEEEKKRFANKQRFYQALSRLSRFQVTTQMTFRPTKHAEYTKGVNDVRTSICRRKLCDYWSLL